MPRRINNDVDKQIMLDLGLGHKNKDIALRYGVSPSYVSKLRRGKKQVDIDTPTPVIIKTVDYDAYEDPVKAAEEFLADLNIVVDEADIEKYLKNKITSLITRTKLYIELLKKYKGE